MPDAASKLIPSITGNAGLDSIVGSAILGASAALTAWLSTWLSTRGYYSDPVVIAGVITSAMVFAAAAIWRYMMGRQAGAVIEQAKAVGAVVGAQAQAEHSGTAVAPELKTPEQVTAALNLAQVPVTSNPQVKP